MHILKHSPDSAARPAFDRLRELPPYPEPVLSRRFNGCSRRFGFDFAKTPGTLRLPLSVLLLVLMQPAIHLHAGTANPIPENPPLQWSLQPLTRPAVPAGSKHPVDAFVLAGLRERGLKPSPPADKVTLLRRVYFDLHGLPPSPEEAEKFAASSDPDIFAKTVDALLASPRHGEHMARHWMDVIHFADTHGFEHDVFRPHAWRFRDYLIESFNRDTPWPRFIREQLAADVFFPDEPRLTAALGFLGAGTYDSSAAGTAIHSFEYLDRDDLVTQTMSSFVSTTAHCARCHDHKFDPVTQEDYFALQAVFAGIGKGDISYDESAETARLRREWTALRTAAGALDRDVLLSPENIPVIEKWETEQGAAAAWRTLTPEVFYSTDGATLQLQPDGALLAAGRRPERDLYSLTFAPEAGKITALRLEVLPDDSLHAKGPGRADNGNFHLSEVEALLFPPGAEAPVKLEFLSAAADWNQEGGWDIAKAIDGNPATAWGIFPKTGEAHRAVFTLKSPLESPPGARLTVLLKQLHGGSHVIGKLRLSVTEAPAASVSILPEELEKALTVKTEERTPEQRTVIASEALRQRAEEELARLPEQVKVYAAARTAENERGMVTFAEPRVIHLLKRGDLAKPEQPVPPGALSAVTALPARFETPPKDEAARRAALAGWIVDPRNPLTWRSIANRVWHFHFGSGLCDTPNDFGKMGGAPSHPELLDWLAAELRDSGGSLKHLHRIILTSETWRQSSQWRETEGGADPDNRLLWRMNRRRLDADQIRDAVRAVSGALDLTMGGPGVQYFKSSPGPQSTPVLDYSAWDWSSAGAGRRSVYRTVWRGIADPFMDALDFPDAAVLTPVRGFSASPLQSLALWNNRFILHYSMQLAKNAGMQGIPLDRHIRILSNRVLLRDPDDQELADFREIAERHGPEAVCRILLNSSEFLFVN